MNTLPRAHDIAIFWRQAGPERWFAKDAAFDAEFKSRFEAAHHAAATGALDGWAAEAEGALALLVLLDQLPRNAWRRSGHMFATDGRARRIARAAIEAGLDLRIEAPLRPFFYLPFMHSESPADQALSVKLNSQLDANTQRFARMHQDIIDRFGRFPHRNEALGRESTEAERTFLENGGFAG